MVLAVSAVLVVLAVLEVPVVPAALVALVHRLHLANLVRCLRPADPEEGRRLSNGRTTRSIGRGLPTATLPHATSIPPQTAQPWTTG